MAPDHRAHLERTLGRERCSSRSSARTRRSWSRRSCPIRTASPPPRARLDADLGELRASLGDQDALAEVRRGLRARGREAKGDDWRVAKSIFVADDDATVRRMTREPGNLSPITSATCCARHCAAPRFKHDPSVPDAAVTDEYLNVAAPHFRHGERGGRPPARLPRSRPFGRLLYVGHDWADAKAMRRSMELMAEKVLPQL